MWTKDVPTEKSMYWFYGFRSELSKRMGTKDLLVVKIRPIVNGMMYVADGNFLDPKEMDGQWLPLEVPALPE